MKVAQLVIAAAVLIPAVSAFAQSTPAVLNDAVHAQLAQEKAAYASTDSNDQKRASAPGVNRIENRSRQITDVNMGRYSMTVATPSN
jgi:predicted nucleic acid-binding protein